MAYPINMESTLGNPPAELVGQTVSVEEIVWDIHNEPVSRTLDILVRRQPGNYSPRLNDPPDRFELQVDVPEEFGNPDENVAPDFIEVQLANGEEVQINVSIDTSQVQATADIVFLLDMSESMDGAIAWLAESVESIEQQLQSVGITNSRFGLVVFGDLQIFYYVGEPGQDEDGPYYVFNGDYSDVPDGVETELLLAPATTIALGLANETGEQHPYLVPFADPNSNAPGYNEQIWGNAAQLATVLRGAIAEGGVERGNQAIGHVFSDDLETLRGQPTQVPFSFRGEAVIDVVMITDEPDNGFSHSVQEQVLETLIGSPNVDSDDILFTTVNSSLLAANDGLAVDPNFGRYITNTLERQITEKELVFAPTTPGDEAVVAVFDVDEYQNGNKFL